MRSYLNGVQQARIALYVMQYVKKARYNGHLARNTEAEKGGECCSDASYTFQLLQLCRMQDHDLMEEWKINRHCMRHDSTIAPTKDSRCLRGVSATRIVMELEKV